MPVVKNPLFAGNVGVQAPSWYNAERPHSALAGRTLAEAYRGEEPVDMMDKPLRALTTSPLAQQQQDG